MALLLALSAAFGAAGQMAIGSWRDALDYNVVYRVAHAGDRVYAAARGAVFCYDLDYGTLTRLCKGNGLNDVGVATMAYSADDRCLVVAYDNANLDLVADGRTYNISDIKRSDVAGDMRIHSIRFRVGRAYLATGFGVVVLDLTRREIKETWYLGAGGSHTAVYDLAFVADSLYAATGEGLKRVAAAERHPAVTDRWQTDVRLSGLQPLMLEPFAGRLMLAARGADPLSLSLYALADTGWMRWNHGDIASMRSGGGLLTLARNGGVVRYNASLQRYDSIASRDWLDATAHDALTDEHGTLWLGHTWAGLVRLDDTRLNAIHPQGPFTQDNVYRLVPFGQRMMLCPGGHTPTYAAAYLGPNLYTTYGSQWAALDDSQGLLHGTHDLMDAAVNPLDTSEVVAALWGDGVVSIRDNRVVARFDEGNTGGALQPLVAGSYRTLLAGAVAFDRKGDLWTLVSHGTHNLAVRRADGTWEGFPTQALGSTLELDKLVVDSITGYKWFCGRSNMIYVHDGKDRMAKVNPNNGSRLSTDNVTALVQDQSGNLWVGTNKGLKVIYDAYRAFQNGGAGEVSPVICSNIIITNGEFSEYLMAYESVTAIAVDGANRKWVGTANGGLYLLSATGMDQLEHFTVANSPLFSDKIIALGINERTGEVYIGTDQGVQIYRGTATYATSMPQSEVFAFPNPVKPDYDGPIAIKGFTRNGIVHITDAAGHTVYSTTANGGQAVWYGRNHKGERVASGVYYVFASDETGGNRSVAKILVVR